jgi:hypothetical protein
MMFFVAAFALIAAFGSDHMDSWHWAAFWLGIGAGVLGVVEEIVEDVLDSRRPKVVRECDHEPED